jgi:hypothetical protein
VAHPGFEIGERVLIAPRPGAEKAPGLVVDRYHYVRPGHDDTSAEFWRIRVRFDDEGLGQPWLASADADPLSRA